MLTDSIKLDSIRAILEFERLDALVVGGVFNVRYVSGAWVQWRTLNRIDPCLWWFSAPGAAK